MSTGEESAAETVKEKIQILSILSFPPETVGLRGWSLSAKLPLPAIG